LFGPAGAGAAAASKAKQPMPTSYNNNELAPPTAARNVVAVTDKDAVATAETKKEERHP